MTYYRVTVNIFDYGDQKACVEEKERERKPKNKYKSVFGLKSFVLWFSSKSIADRLVSQIRNGVIGFDYVYEFYMPRRFAA